MRKRKKRSDRAYLIYVLTCGVSGKKYVGVVVRQGNAILKTLKQRLHQHEYRAMNLGKDWTLHQHIRKVGVGVLRISHLETVRGKAAAHYREVQHIDGGGYSLNTKTKVRA